MRLGLLLREAAGNSDLPNVPTSLMQAEAGNNPSLPFLPAKHGA